MVKFRLGGLLLVILGTISSLVTAAELPPMRDEIIAAMQPYVGPGVDGVDRTTLSGKVMAGYQGWFTRAGDSANLGWHYYQSHGEFRAARAGQ